jgi:predicted dehydrogenase
MVRVGVIGVNGMGQAHLWASHSVDGVELAAICDVDRGRAETAAHDFSVPAFTDVPALVASSAVDAVVIATPPGTHGEIVRTALAAGLHVYCEKPIAPTSDEGYALAALARERGRVLQVGFQYRFHRGYQAMRGAVAGVGAVRRVELVATNWFRAQRYFDAAPWRGTWRMAGGGVLMIQAVHQLDVLVSTLGRPMRVRGEVRAACHRAQVEDDAFADLEWGSGARGTVVASLNEPAGEERFEIVGDRGAVQLRDGYDLRVARHEPIAAYVADLDEEYPADPLPWQTIDVPRARSEWFDMLLDAYRDFAGAITGGTAPAVDGDEGTHAVEVANAIYLSSCTGAAVDLPLAPGSYSPVYEELASGRSLLGS